MTNRRRKKTSIEIFTVDRKEQEKGDIKNLKNTYKEWESDPKNRAKILKETQYVARSSSFFETGHNQRSKKNITNK